MSGDAIDGLRNALALTPGNHALRLLLVDQLVAAGRGEEALAEVAALIEAGAVPAERAVELGHRALEHEHVGQAEALLAVAERAGRIEGVAALRDGILAARSSEGVVALRVIEGGEAAEPTRTLPTAEARTFDDVGGLADLKKVVHRRIVLPFTRPGLLKRYGKRAGGGVLLYGPPGCGKTLLARATAGACGLPCFVSRIDEILAPWVGQSERNLHAVFEAARGAAPCLLFLDELDAIGFARSRMHGEHQRGLVDQLLQELDGMADRNDDVLVLAATNAPWDLDDALLRPGRFDRTLFVPPPDAEARAEILRIHLQGRPAEGIDPATLAARTERFSGADLEGLVERAFDEVVEEALETGTEPPCQMRHLEAALAQLRPSTGPWLERARNYVEFANRDERWSDVARYLASSRGRGRF